MENLRHLHPAGLGHEEVAQLVDRHQHAKQEHEEPDVSEAWRATLIVPGSDNAHANPAVRPMHLSRYASKPRMNCT